MLYSLQSKRIQLKGANYKCRSKFYQEKPSKMPLLQPSKPFSSVFLIEGIAYLVKHAKIKDYIKVFKTI